MLRLIAVGRLRDGDSVDANMLIVRGFLFPNHPSNTPVTAKAVAKRLKAYVGEPVRHGARVLVLKSFMDKHAGVNKFHVVTIG
jgi:hypothetical protein